MPENFQLQPDNGIFIKSWMGELNDRALRDLLPLLRGFIILHISIQKLYKRNARMCASVSRTLGIK
jgi:CTD small phosphatase-like protein 2